ncbi:MAG: outer membrane beta-barrel protein [Saprospiraceae bacterium]
MKTKLFTFLMITASLPLFSQNGLEISVGPGFTNITLNGLNKSLRPHTDLHPGIQASVLYNQMIGEGFSIAAGVSYKQKGFIISESMNTTILNIPLKLGVSAATTINYAELPITLKYTLPSENGVKISAYAGPSVGYALDGNIRTRANMLIDLNISKTNLDLTDPIYNRVELGANMGIGAALPMRSGNLVVGIQYNQGFSRVIDNTLLDFKARNYGFGASIGYKINF